MKKSYSGLLAVTGLAVIALGGCTSVRQALGSEKTAPDEFRVVSKAPLVVPPEFNLRPPRPGEARPMELRADLQARSAVFGVQLGATASDGERLLVEKAGGTNADPRIRAVIDEETGGVARKPTNLSDRIMGFVAPAPTQPADPLLKRKQNVCALKRLPSAMRRAVNPSASSRISHAASNCRACRPSQLVKIASDCRIIWSTQARKRMVAP